MGRSREAVWLLDRQSYVDPGIQSYVDPGSSVAVGVSEGKVSGAEGQLPDLQIGDVSGQ
jgi:hypothetical protein